MNELKVFESMEFGQLRVIEKDGEAWFIGKDITEKLKYQNGSRDVERHVDLIDRDIFSIFDGKQNRNTLCINESGLYGLIFGSKLETAKQFKNWVTRDILPSIRKHGGYPVEENKVKEKQEKLFYHVGDVIRLLDGVSESYAYKKIRELNKELESKGFLITAGQISKKYFHERHYL